MAERANPIAVLKGFLQAAGRHDHGTTFDAFGAVLGVAPGKEPARFARKLGQVSATLSSVDEAVRRHPRFDPAIHLRWLGGVDQLLTLTELHVAWKQRRTLLDGNFFYRMDVDAHLIEDGMVALPLILTEHDCVHLARMLEEVQDEVVASALPEENRQLLTARIAALIHELQNYSLLSSQDVKEQISSALGELVLIRASLTDLDCAEGKSRNVLVRVGGALIHAWTLHKEWGAVKTIPDTVSDVAELARRFLPGL